jgi:hypothetical protein
LQQPFHLGLRQVAKGDILQDILGQDLDIIRLGDALFQLFEAAVRLFAVLPIRFQVVAAAYLVTGVLPLFSAA